MNDLELQSLLDRQAKFRSLRQTPSPQGQMVSGHFVAPNALQYLAAGLRGYGGIKGEEQANAEIQGLQQKRQAMDTEAMGAFSRLMQDQPARQIQPITPNDDEGNPNVPAQMDAQRANPRGAFEALMGAYNPQMRQAGMQGMIRIPEIEAERQFKAEQLKAQQQEREDMRLFRQQEAQAAREARAQELQMKLQDQRTSQAEKLQAQRELQQMQIDARKEMQQMIAANRPAAQAPQVQTLQTESGILERRGNEWVPISVGGKPAMPKGAAGAGNATEGERKAATLLQRMQNSEAQLEEALKKDKTAEKPGLISSGIRATGMEALANTVTPENRQKVEAAQLDILDAALTLGTGAAYTKEQLEGYRKSYFPQLGDKPETIKDKQARLNNILAAARIAAGRSASQVTAQVPPSANPTVNPSLVNPGNPRLNTQNPPRLRFDAQGNPIP
jgi:hypothetical protein